MDTFFVVLFKTLSYICYCQGENMKISLPVYSKGEEVINSMTHGVGAVLSLIGTFIDECHPSYIFYKEVMLMKTKTFILKFLRLISLILLLSTLLVLVVKN